MKVCSDHVKNLIIGSTYQVVNKDECVVCRWENRIKLRDYK